ncbi:hypothetical protein [Galactobacter caseinivorans]|uniref:EcsC family protein n=1 Tax=Galactobacter caseinivorans TaxID=2676123 RepID=A0A496PKX0_9MICC|nr:hypothetical protein [Galactobacter caseinivorans]RKW71173.1 hypothetical protein DWQ67_05130 [Galactobacter caseinivorans]
MNEKQPARASGQNFAQLLDRAAQLPGVRIDREKFLRSALKRYCTEDEINRAVLETPATAGIPLKTITAIANSAITHETSRVTGLSTAAGFPGGLAMVGTVPADAAQFVGHMLRIAQKLAYIYSWPDLFVDDGKSDEIDEATQGMLILFVGVMLGVSLAQTGVTKVSSLIAAQVAKKLPQQALTKGAVYPIVKRVAGYLGVSMTKKLFATGVAKAVPVVGALLSGGLTLGTFLPMSKKLQKHLASLELTKPGLRPDDLIPADPEPTS